MVHVCSMCAYYVNQILLWRCSIVRLCVLSGFFLGGGRGCCCLSFIWRYAKCTCNNIVNLSAYSCQDFAFRKAQLQSKSPIDSLWPCSDKINQMQVHAAHTTICHLHLLHSKYIPLYNVFLIQSIFNLILSYLLKQISYVYSAKCNINLFIAGRGK